MKIRLHLGEIQRILKEYEPACICIQHMNTPVQNIGIYILAVSSLPNYSSLGTAIYVHKKVTCDKIHNSKSLLQVSALRLHLPGNKITICNLYNQPNQNYDLKQLPSLLSKLQQPLLIVVDFNAHHPL